MKKIEAIVKPVRVEDIREALDRLGIEGMTVSEVRRYGPPKRRGRVYFQGDGEIEYLPNVKVEVVVPDASAPAAVAAVVRTAKPGRNGEGQVFVTEILRAVRIRTEECNEAAI